MKAFKVSLIAAGFATLFTTAVFAEETRSFTYLPDGGYPSTTDATFVAPSAKTALNVGDKIGNLTQRNFNGDVIVQKLTDNAYWVQIGFYNTVFLVGDDGVLLMDPLAYGSGEAVLAAIADVTDKPVTAVVYSHHHEDHIGDISVFEKAAKDAGVKLEIIATDATAKGMKAHGSEVTPATKELKFSGDSFTFGDETITVYGLADSAHTYDSALWILENAKIAHIPDVVNPDQMPYLNFGGSDTFEGYEDNLAFIKAKEWKYFSGGHGNIGSKDDFTFMQEYVADLKAATGDALGSVNPGDYFVAKYNNHQASAKAYYDAITAKAMDTLRPKYGEFYGFEASVPDQIVMVRDAISH
ncbi:MBL fold metallo-hydrolase [Enterovibrio norvegicus]|uniref:Glyoxylase, beta-lactamase superfamily II n=1 Tax=Enterovibrio norvegicus DSM 15893 TaxID=1121869 RepID=A0A1I5NI91_9GAMM|nr:MBL fold metallo-hydrolase [Enterovibrio norvegicus]SFP21523.1 Glyoxylase, beta-lactamase superfamily II [Enterovibrio norvegicus DSM 15893]